MLGEIPASELAQREAMLRAQILGSQTGDPGWPVPSVTHPTGGGFVSHPVGPPPFITPTPAHEPAGAFGPPRPVAGAIALSTVTPEGSKLYSVNFLTGVVETSLGSFVLDETEIAKVAYVALQALDRSLGNVLTALAKQHGVDKLLQNTFAGAETATASEPAAPPAPVAAAAAPTVSTLPPEVMAGLMAQLEGMTRASREEDDELEPPLPDPVPTPEQVKASRKRTRKS